MSGMVRARTEQAAVDALGLTLWPLQILLSEPWLLFGAFLTAVLFRPPGFLFFPWDRLVFGLLIYVAALRGFMCRGQLFLGETVTLPLLALMLLSLGGVVTREFDPQVWSLFAAKWLVPFVLFQIAGQLLESPHFQERFETFALLALAYLIFIAIAFLIGARGLIFPSFILDDGVGMHADRARGPLLQAVANGVALNLLGLIALNAYRRKTLRGAPALLLLAGLPLAIVATKTRSVWLAFAGSVLLLLFRAPERRLRRACTGLAIACAMGLAACVSLANSNCLAERLGDRSPVEFRMALYRAGWEMFQAKPLLGWGAEAMQTELGKRISDFRQEAYYFHNTYLEILVEHGALGLGIYCWLAVDLFRVGRKRGFGAGGNGFLDRQFRSMWPVFVLVYLVNGSFVVMNYQFVNGLLFSIAGMLAAQNRMGAERG